MDPARSKTPCTYGNTSGGNREIPRLPFGRGSRRPHGEVQERKPMMDGRGKSDSPILPGKSPNKAPQGAAEGMEGRGLAKGNLLEQNALRTQGRRMCAPSALERVRQAAKRDRKQASPSPRLSSLSFGAPRRHHLRQEPGAVVPHAGICAGGGPQGPFLPRPYYAVWHSCIRRITSPPLSPAASSLRTYDDWSLPTRYTRGDEISLK